MAIGAPGLLRHGVLYLSIIVSMFLALGSGYPRLTAREDEGLELLGAFLVSGLLAYCLVFFLSPGYVFTGYRFRLAPITVFHTNTIAAIAAFALLAMAVRPNPPAGPADRSPFAGTPRQLTANFLAANTGRAAGVLMLASVAWYWIALQYTYFQILPPDSYQFLRKLEHDPYRGKSFIVNNYAAPVAAATGQWAYLHASLTEGRLAQKDGRFVVELDDTYLWLADKQKNSEYRYPDYFICITPQSLPLAIDRLNALRGQGSGPTGCAQHALVRVASGRDPLPISPKVELLEIDRAGNARLGFERWAIVKFSWPTNGAADPSGLSDSVTGGR